MTRMLSAALIVLAMMASTVVEAQDKAAPKTVAATASAPLNLNTATLTQLESLPGIGMKVAERIVEFRQKNGGFKKVEEILEISRSPLILLRIIGGDPPPTVSESRKKSQEISRGLGDGGRSGGRT